MTKTPPPDLLVTTDADLARLWQALVGPGGPDRRSLWLLFLGPDGRPEPVVVPIDDVPARPDGLVRALDGVIRGLTDTDSVGSVAVLLSRPGPDLVTADDLAWARALRPLTPRWPVHLAAAGRVHACPADDPLPQDAVRGRAGAPG